ncbi:DEAD/DEAH box helicase [Owenweeksia hongkongensis]|nr:DEAD/DEAH box helicase [Owenweeksia hongkongensis]
MKNPHLALSFMKPQNPNTKNLENAENYEPYSSGETSVEKHLANYPSAKKEPESEGKTIVVIGQHRYYKLFSAQLIQCKLTKGAQLKNPLNITNPIDFMWQAERPEELKFYAAISKFQTFYDKSEADKEALRLLFKNPARYQFYEHDHRISEKVNIRSVSPVSVSVPAIDFQIRVERNAKMYSVFGELTINEMPCLLHEIEVRLGQFITRGSSWYLCENHEILEAISYFKKHENEFKLKEKSFEAFQRDVLSEMENYIPVNRTYIKSISKEFTQEVNAQLAPQKLIYIAEDGDYISLTPAMRYGNQEVALRSKKQLYGLDTRGDTYFIKRDDTAEDQFSAMLMRQHPHLPEQMENELQYYYLHKAHFLDENWFLKAFDEWQQNDIQVLGFNEIKGNKFNPNKAKVNIEVTSGLNWFNTNVEVKFGNQKASLKHLSKAVKNKSRYVQLDDGTMGIIPEEWLLKFAKYFNSAKIQEEALIIPKMSFTAVEEMYDEQLLDSQVLTEIADYRSKLTNFKEVETVSAPKDLQASLRSYQLQGLSWLNFLDDFNFGGCLADDMGLGKTIQVIAFILHLREKRSRKTHFLVLPTSLIHNWEIELEKFASSIKYNLHHGPNRPKTTDHFSDYDLVITTYQTLVSDVSFIREFTFGYVFLDESQNIKNTTSQRYKAACLLQSLNRLVLTGTPIENNTFDLYAQLSFACPGLLGTKTFFRHTYAVPIDKFKKRDSAKALQDTVSPFILRRTKKEVAKELPEKTEVTIFCEMGPEQRRVYDAYEKEFREYLSAHDDEEIDKNPMHVLRGITRLRQICNAPQLVGEDKLKGETPAKIAMLMEQLRSITGNHKVLVFSQFVSMLDLIQNELKTEKIKHVSLTGSTKNRGAVVKQFQENEDTRVFLISLKAGGTGLNLTAADYVFLVDPWWNPAVENQAIDRVYRIGQEKHVIAARLICPDTVEEKIQLMQEDKSHLAKKLVGESKPFLKGMGKEAMLGLVR